MPKLGERVVLEPERLVAGGDSLSRFDGLPVFTPGAYPGDRIEALVTKRTRGFAKAELSRVLIPSPLRRERPCSVATTCGGCDWTELRLDAQLRAKREILRESLIRTGRLAPAQLPPISLHVSPLFYRLRARMHVDSNGAVGFYARRTNEIVPIPDDCEIVSPGMISAARGAAATIRDEDVDLVLTPSGVLASPSSRGIEASVEGPDRSWKTSTDGFFQVNRHMLGALHDLVETRIADAPKPEGTAFDLYAGVGFFSPILASHFDHVRSVEISVASHRAAIENLAHEPRIEAILGSATDAFADPDPRLGLIMVDPPRGGLDRALPELISRSKASRLVYLSCDPVTFARDTARLTELGFQLETLDLIDLFPNTHHLETLGRFDRKPRG